MLNNKSILVTGGTGLIGRQIVDILINVGAKVTVSSLDDLKQVIIYIILSNLTIHLKMKVIFTRIF